ncbi:MAG: MBL fold metallo-hydrolase [Hydrogenophilales bacterium]|nr:MBL fold metallo-hydrolase [Hydrogenophilales bacterium]
MQTIVASLLILVSTLAQAASLPAPKVQKINERVYALLGPMELPNKNNQGYMVNTTAIIGEKGVILVDTGFTDEIGKHLAKAIAKLTPKPVTHIINTHHHGDHHLGNIAFKGAEIISTQQCKELVEKTGYEWIDMVQNLSGGKFPNTKPVPAGVTVTENTRTERVIDGVKIVLWAPKGSHTPGDLIVYLPDDRVLMGGDILVNQITPNFRDGHVKTWIGTLDVIQKTNVKTIVPGHGPLMTQADVAAMHKRMAKLYAGVEAGYKKGLSDAEIRKTLDLSQWKKLRHFEDQMGGNINRAYLEVEAANF